MTKHDTWAVLRPDSPFASISKLFPDGFPIRDPFPMDKTPNNEPLFVIDRDRLNPEQENALITLYLKHFPPEGNYQSISLCLKHKWVESMIGGAECYRRSLELMNFMDEHPEIDEVALNNFIKQQKRDWIDGDRVPEAMPEDYEDVDPRYKTLQLEKAYKQKKIEKFLAENQYSILDVLTGKAMVDALNHADPENEYTLGTQDVN